MSPQDELEQGGGGSLRSSQQQQRRKSSLYPLANYANKHGSTAPDDDDADNNNYHDENFQFGNALHSNDTKLGRIRNKVGYVINCRPVQFVMTSMIIINAVLLGVLTLDAVRFNPPLLKGLEYLDLAILISFTIEFICQLFYMGPFFLKSTWLVFDMVVILFSWIFMGGSAKVLRSFRIFRVFSLASKWTSMQQLFSAVGNTVPKMGNVACLLLLLFYAVTVLCTTLYGPLYDGGYLDYDYFGRLDLTFITLFQMLTTDTWLVIVRQVMDAHPYSYILFFFWVSLTAIIIVNLIIAIICESIIDLKEAEQEVEDEQQSEAFKVRVPMEGLLQQQRDIDFAQAQMELAINALMLRLPAA